jgi:DNA-binding NtrC family response regulator
VNSESFDFNNSSVLLVDDEPGMRTALRANFLRHGWQVETADGVRAATSAMERREFDLVVTDVRMRDGDGFEVMEMVRKDSPRTAVILLTAYGSVSEAVESMRNGAFDYLTKPVSFDQLQAAAARVMQRMQEQEQQPKEVALATAPALIAQPTNSGIVGRSPRLLQALQRARAAATTSADVLVEAESGAGKELLAKFIHDESNRANKPFIAINCAAVPENLIESELFGHARGAFTGATNAKMGKFESAHGGTLLLDEIGEMPLNLQPKLLRVLQERSFERLGETKSIHVDVRVIATTNASLATMVEHGTFRSDLYYRLNVIPLSLPPLREHTDDIPALARHFAERFAASSECAVPVLDPGFIQLLQTHNWPGNIRELANFMRRVLSLNAGSLIDASCFRREFRPIARPTPAPTAPAAPMTVPSLRIADLEKVHLENTLALTGGNRTHAAAMLGISLRTVRNKIKEYGLPPRSYA